MPKCRLFAIDEGLKEVVPGGLYSKHLFGTSVSVSVVKFVLPEGPSVQAKAHSHGEEASLQISGSCSLLLGTGEGAADPEFLMDEGAALLIPARAMHYGTNVFQPDGVSMRLNVVTPPRKEFGPENTVPYYPMQSRK